VSAIPVRHGDLLAPQFGGCRDAGDTQAELLRSVPASEPPNSRSSNAESQMAVPRAPSGTAEARPLLPQRTKRPSLTGRPLISRSEMSHGWVLLRCAHSPMLQASLSKGDPLAAVLASSPAWSADFAGTAA
jgi:hypothetical protein